MNNVQPLAGLKNLRELYLFDTRVTDLGPLLAVEILNRIEISDVLEDGGSSEAQASVIRAFEARGCVVLHTCH